MNDRPPHLPKTGALIAYDAGALSAAGRARLERHLAGCDVCRDELASVRLWTRESTRIRALSERPPVDFAKMELAIVREAGVEARRARSERSQRSLGVAIPICAVAAAALLTVGLSRMAGPIVRPSGPPSASTVADLGPRTPFVPTVTLAAGDARIVRDTISRAASAGEVMEVGETLEVGDGEAHVRFADHTGLVALGPTSLGLSRGLDDGTGDRGLEVTLSHGRLSVDVALPLHGASTFIVLAASYRIEARVARVVIDLEAPAGELAVSVESGSVVLVDGDDRTTLSAPAQWPASAAEVTPHAVAGLEPDALEGVHLDVAAPEIVRWEIGAYAALGSGLSMLVSRGDHDLVGYDADGSAFRYHVVAANNVRLEGDDLVPDAPRLREGSLSRAILMSVVSESAGRLEHCYQQALRLRALSGDITARIRLSPRGVVMGVRIMSEDAPPSLERCVTAEAERWTFPPPGGPMSFDVPLSFRSR